MKRIGGLFGRIHARANLAEAVRRAARGKRDRREVLRFLESGESGLAEMEEAMRLGTFRFEPYRAFEVRDTKTRTIHAPTFRDRVAHHAIIAVTGPVFESGALAHSYACRAGRGQHAAIAQARHWLRRDDWYGKMDVRKFYDSVGHEPLRAMLRRRFRESRLLALFDALLDSYESGPGRGLPIGALTSQYLGNFVLDRLDHGVKAAGHAHRYLRYMDDALVLGSRAQVAEVRAVAGAILEALGLELKHGGEWNRVTQGVPFLGFVLYPDRMRVNRPGRKRFRAKLRAVRRLHESGVLDESGAQARLTALAAHVCKADDVNWRRVALGFHDFGSSFGRPKGDTPEPRPRGPRRQLEQHGQELPRDVSQQQEARKPEQESGLPRGALPRHEGGERMPPPTDGACSRSAVPATVDEASRKPPPHVDIPAEHGRENTSGGAATFPGPKRP